MKRWLPFPVLSIFLLVMWLLLNQSLSAGHIVIGCIVAIAGPLTLSALQLPSGGWRRPHAILRLSIRVTMDIIRSNIAVARIILTPGHKALDSGFVTIPLELRDHYGLAVLACIITSTPGTIWVNFNSARGTLMIHVLNLTDENWIDTIKLRYEKPLLEIFE